MDVSRGDLNLKDFSFDLSFTNKEKTKVLTQGEVYKRNESVKTQSDTLQNLFQQWGAKIEQLELNIQDVEKVKKQVSSTLEKARVKKSIEDKENFKALQNTNKEQSYVSQKYEYNNFKDDDHSVVLSPFDQKISLHLETSEVDTEKNLTELRPIGDFFMKAKAEKISLHLETSEVDTQKNLTQLRPIGDFLMKAKAENYINNFLDLGVYDTQSLLERLGSEANQNKNLITIFGVDKIGKRKSIMLQMMEELGEFERQGLLKYTDQVEFEELPSIDEWLESIDKSQYLSNFLDAGYDDFEKLMEIQTSGLQIKNSQQLALEISVRNLNDMNQVFESLNQLTKNVLDFNFVNSEQNVNQMKQNTNIETSRGCSGRNIGCSMNQITGNCKIF